MNFIEAMSYIFSNPNNKVQITTHSITWFQANEKNTCVDSYFTNGEINTKNVIITNFLINSQFKKYKILR
jgi:hypothetical protein